MKIKRIKREYILLAVILLFALFLRLYALGQPALWIDETISSVASSEILEKGVPAFDSGVLYERAYVFHYLQAFFLLFGMNDFNVRLVSVIFGLLSIVLAYFIGKEYSKAGGIISALFMAVFYLEVFYSRQARFYQLFQFAFFLSIFLLYKSKKNPKMLYFALIAFLIAYDTQIAALILAPFFILHILLYNRKQWYLAFIPAFILIFKAVIVLGFTSDSAGLITNYIENYAGYTANIKYLLILCVPGIAVAFFKNKKLTSMIVLPSLILLFGIFFVKLFAFRYLYFFVFPIVLFSSLLMAFFYQKLGKLILIPIIILLLFPSNLFFPYTYVNVIKPVHVNYNDFSAPEVDYKSVPQNIFSELKNSENNVIVFFSPSFEWYVRKPDFVFDFSLSGLPGDSLERNGKDIYSGAQIIKSEKDISEYLIGKEFYFVAENFAVGKLNLSQKDNFNRIISGCETAFSSDDMIVWKC